MAVYANNFYARSCVTKNIGMLISWISLFFVVLLLLLLLLLLLFFVVVFFFFLLLLLFVLVFGASNK